MAVAVSPHLRLIDRCRESQTGLGLQFLQIECSELVIEHDNKCSTLGIGRISVEITSETSEQQSKRLSCQYKPKQSESYWAGMPRCLSSRTNWGTYRPIHSHPSETDKPSRMALCSQSLHMAGCRRKRTQRWAK